jgi:hypothetical protein
VNHRMKKEKKRKAGAKWAKEAFDRLARQDTSGQFEDKSREITTLRSKEINSGNRQFNLWKLPICGRHGRKDER